MHTAIYAACSGGKYDERALATAAVTRPGAAVFFSLISRFFFAFLDSTARHWIFSPFIIVVVVGHLVFVFGQKKRRARVFVSCEVPLVEQVFHISASEDFFSETPRTSPVFLHRISFRQCSGIYQRKIFRGLDSVQIDALGLSLKTVKIPWRWTETIWS